MVRALLLSLNSNTNKGKAVLLPRYCATNLVYMHGSFKIMNFLHTHTQRLLSVFVLSLALSACSSGTDDPPMPPDIVDDLPTPSTEPEEPIGSGAVPITCVEANAAPVADAEDAPYFAFATGLAPNAPGNSIGRLLRVSVSETPVLSGCAFRAGADIQVATDGTSVYEIGAGLLDSISQFDVDSLEENYRYSVKGLDVSANPQDIEFLNNNKAYVIRYDSSSLWIVNPSATTEEDFYLGEINLSAYGSYHSYDADSGVQMIDAEIVDGKLFVLLQRLQDASAPLDAYVVVIDTESDTEISTGQGADGFDGIRLDVGDTQRLFFNEETNDVMVIGRGYLSDYEDIGRV